MEQHRQLPVSQRAFCSSWMKTWVSLMGAGRHFSDWCLVTSSHITEPPSPQHCSGLAFSVVRASASVCEELKIFTPAGLRWSPGHGQPNYCLSKATDMPGILETKPNQNPSLKICFEPWGFSRGLHGSKHKIREFWASYRRKQKTQNRKDT